MENAEHLASHRRCVERIEASWEGFRTRRLEHLRERERYGHAAERATENILEDLFTLVLDWSIADLNHQVEFADILLTRLGIKYLIVEAKRPGALAWNRRAVESALEQAHRYASEQKVSAVAVSDGYMIYAADLVHGGLRDRVFVSLEEGRTPQALWWLSVDGIYRTPEHPEEGRITLLPELPAEMSPETTEVVGGILHSKYQLPASCFAHVGDASDPKTWHLPYLLSDHSVDLRRLPKAIQAILSNYRGARVRSIPESDIPDVLVRLGRAAASVGKMADEPTHVAAVYAQLVAVLEQLGRLNEVISK